jgi:hypothetical protein
VSRGRSGRLGLYSLLLGHCLLLGFAAARLEAAPSAPSPPALVRGAAQELLLTSLPPLLGSKEVRRHLETGLTTTFAFEVRVSGAAKARGGGRVDIRYELWDEVWLVTRLDGAGQAQRLRFAAFPQLEAWWRDLRLPVLRAPGSPGSGVPGGRADIQLRVIPFSQSEQLDAQRWLSRSLAEESGEPGAVAGLRNEPSEDLLQLLLATSIGRPPLLELRWKLAVPPAGPAPPGEIRR